jgi:hypothetical protein
VRASPRDDVFEFLRGHVKEVEMMLEERAELQQQSQGAKSGVMSLKGKSCQ